MTLIEIESVDWTDEERNEFLPTALSVNKHIERFYEHRQQGQHAKMKAIGELEEFKRQHPQRSKAARLITAGYQSEEWSDATVSENATAYREYIRLKDMNDAKLSKFAEGAPLFLLIAMGRQYEKQEDNTLWYPAFVYWKKHGKYPTRNQIRGYLGGYTTDDFVFLGSLSSKSESSAGRKLRSSESWDTSTNTSADEPDAIEVAPATNDLALPLTSINQVQQGIDMLLTSLNLIGSIDELAMSNHYLDQLMPHRMTIEMLSDVLNAQPALTWRR